MTDVRPSILSKGRFLRLPDALKCTMETSWRLSLNFLSVTILMQTLTAFGAWQVFILVAQENA